MDKRIDTRRQVLNSSQHLVPTNRVESVPEVQLDQGMVRLQLAEVKSGGMDCGFRTTTDPITQLLGGQQVRRIVHNLGPSNLGYQPAQGTTYSNGPPHLLSYPGQQGWLQIEMGGWLGGFPSRTRMEKEARAVRREENSTLDKLVMSFKC